MSIPPQPPIILHTQFAHIRQVHKPHPKSKFTPEEDNLLKQLVNQFGENNWVHIAERMPHRNMRQCKERWQNYLSPKVCHAPWTLEEDTLLEQKFKEYGPKWVRIALSFPNRTDTNVKNRWLVLSRRSKKEQNMRSLPQTIPIPTVPHHIQNQHIALQQQQQQQQQQQGQTINSNISSGITHGLAFPQIPQQLNQHISPQISPQRIIQLQHHITSQLHPMANLTGVNSMNSINSINTNMSSNISNHGINSINVNHTDSVNSGIIINSMYSSGSIQNSNNTINPNLNQSITNNLNQNMNNSRNQNINNNLNQSINNNLNQNRNNNVNNLPSSINDVNNNVNTSQQSSFDQSNQQEQQEQINENVKPVSLQQISTQTSEGQIETQSVIVQPPPPKCYLQGMTENSLPPLRATPKIKAQIKLQLQKAGLANIT
ncbi:hypothetical protein TRFO_24674 [Tritrichomonas foetus]|uniref:Myb-like DNA-binding domain containing protein n=1 Tax=Tritrichomonas foetus TaxID=1144522 RepID=A0A1J4K7T5_9EUKA|nr:hypothetical protein TRFO_24674 [Tritrichomonas foetus]|eukprot:OHT07259.1 hypothetical protein TRFO_24674 [Tritrichomonas foetus]